MTRNTSDNLIAPWFLPDIALLALGFPLLTNDLGVIYASTTAPQDLGFLRLRNAVTELLHCCRYEEPKPELLWKLQYHQKSPTSAQRLIADENGVLALPLLSADLTLDDSVIGEVKKAWKMITGEPEERFMKFEARDGMQDEDE